MTRSSPESLALLPPPLIPEISPSSIKVSLVEILHSQQTRVTSHAEDDVWEAMEKDLFEDGLLKDGAGSIRGKKSKILYSGREGAKTICAVGGKIIFRIFAFYSIYL